VWFDYLPESETTTQTGVIVKKVYAGMAAQQAGIKAGEIVTQINGVDASDPPTAVALLAENAAGEKVRLTVIEKAGGGIRRFDVFAIMGDKASAEFAKLKKTSASCPSSKANTCTPFSRTPDRAKGIEGHRTVAVLGWMLFVLCVFTGFGLIVHKIWRLRKSAR
jgi:hypothetical protein